MLRSRVRRAAFGLVMAGMMVVMGTRLVDADVTPTTFYNQVIANTSPSEWGALGLQGLPAGNTPPDSHDDHCYGSRGQWWQGSGGFNLGTMGEGDQSAHPDQFVCAYGAGAGVSGCALVNGPSGGAAADPSQRAQGCHTGLLGYVMGGGGGSVGPSVADCVWFVPQGAGNTSPPSASAAGYRLWSSDPAGSVDSTHANSWFATIRSDGSGVDYGELGTANVSFMGFLPSVWAGRYWHQFCAVNYDGSDGSGPQQCAYVDSSLPVCSSTHSTSFYSSDSGCCGRMRTYMDAEGVAAEYGHGHWEGDSQVYMLMTPPKCASYPFVCSIGTFAGGIGFFTWCITVGPAKCRLASFQGLTSGSNIPGNCGDAGVLGASIIGDPSSCYVSSFPSEMYWLALGAAEAGGCIVVQTGAGGCSNGLGGPSGGGTGTCPPGQVYMNMSGSCKAGLGHLPIQDCSVFSTGWDVGQDINWLECMTVDAAFTVANLFIDMGNLLIDLVEPSANTFRPFQQLGGAMNTRIPFAYAGSFGSGFSDAWGAPAGTHTFTFWLGPSHSWTLDLSSSSLAILDPFRPEITALLYLSTVTALFYMAKHELRTT